MKKSSEVIENYINNAIRFFLAGDRDSSKWQTGMCELVYALKCMDMKLYDDLRAQLEAKGFELGIGYPTL